MYDEIVITLTKSHSANIFVHIASAGERRRRF